VPGDPQAAQLARLDEPDDFLFARLRRAATSSGDNIT
jgi:hypothetical protein